VRTGFAPQLVTPMFRVVAPFVQLVSMLRDSPARRVTMGFVRTSDDSGTPNACAAVEAARFNA
jgi:hypothetical protein